MKLQQMIGYIYLSFATLIEGLNVKLLWFNCDLGHVYTDTS